MSQLPRSRSHEVILFSQASLRKIPRTSAQQITIFDKNPQLCRGSHSIVQRMLSLQKARRNVYKTNNGKPSIFHYKTIE